MALEEVTRAIKNLGNNDDEEEASSSQKVIEILDDSDNSDASEKSNSDVNYRRSKSDKFDNNSRFFCYEDTFFTKDISVEVEGIGKIGFPISEASIQDMIKMSSKAKFGKGEETLIDISVRDTQVIPACKLKVKLDEQTLSEVLERISTGLNIGKECVIKPHLYNMLIYGPGQFFKKHQDSEKIPHMIATLVIVLPSIHKGGDLIIEHNNYKHAFFGSQNPGIIKCVAFYSDCHHEIKKVIEGYRVALTYNIVMESSVISSAVTVNKNLDNAVANYFDGDSRKRLIYLLNHSYSKNNLKWSALKGTDRTHAHALFSVAKKQDRMLYLALADCQETRYSDDWCDQSDDENIITSGIDLYFWVNEQNLNPDKSNFEIYDTSFGSWFPSYISKNEISYTARTAKLFEPYKKKDNGFSGNEGASCDYWYKRACVVLFSSKWVFKEGFKFAVNELYQLTFQIGNEDRLLEEINKAGESFYNYVHWSDPLITDMLIKIVIYLNNLEKATLILCQLLTHLLNTSKIEALSELENQYDINVWAAIMGKRKLLRISDKRFSAEDAKTDIKTVIKFIEKFKSFAPNSVLIDYLVTEIVDIYIMKISMKNLSSPYRIDSSLITEFCMLLKTCTKTGHVIGKKTIMDHAKTNYQTLTQADILLKLQEDLDPVDFVEYCDFKDYLIKLIDRELENIDPGSWKISVKTVCSCKFCIMVNVFLKSQTQTKLVVAAPERNRKHISSSLYKLGNLIKTDTERTGSPYKLIIEKQGKVLSDRQNLIEELNVRKVRLQSITFTEQLVLVKTEKEDMLDSNIISKEEGEHLADTDIKAENIPVCAKTEPVDNFELQTNIEIVKTATQVEKENQLTTQVQMHIEVEGTSPENQVAAQLQTCIKVEGTSPARFESETKSSIEVFSDCKIESEDDDCDNGDDILPSKRKKMSDE